MATRLSWCAQGSRDGHKSCRTNLMPPRRRPDPEPTLSIFPDQVHIGDRFMDADIGDEDKEWEVASRPVTFKTGHEVRARIQRPGDPGTAREKCWAAHQKITVRRVTAAATRPQPEPDDVVDVEALHRELRRLRAEVLGLQEEKQDLERRNAHLAREME